MEKSKNGKQYALIAGICYAVIAIYSILYFILISVHSYGAVTISIDLILSWMVSIGLAIALFINSKKTVLVFAGVNTLLNIYSLIHRYFSSSWQYSLFGFFDFLAYIALILIIVLSLKGNRTSSKIFYFAAVLLLVGYLILWINNEYFPKSFFIRWKNNLINIIECLALMFSGIWIKCDYTSFDVVQTNNYTNFGSLATGNNQSKAVTIGEADRLKICKDLLDSGVITREEFEQKKNQIFRF